MEGAEWKFIEDICHLEVGVYTNCPQGGDDGHGGETLLDLIGSSGANMSVAADDDDFQQDVSRILIRFGGDSEAIVFAKALIWAGETLKRELQRSGGWREDEI